MVALISVLSPEFWYHFWFITYKWEDNSRGLSPPPRFFPPTIATQEQQETIRRFCQLLSVNITVNSGMGEITTAQI